MNTYSEEFKKEAVRLLSVSGTPAAPVARDLGIRKSVLYRGRDEYGDRSEAGLTIEQENARLRPQVRNVINLRIEPRKIGLGSCFPHPEPLSPKEMGMKDLF